MYVYDANDMNLNNMYVYIYISIRLKHQVSRYIHVSICTPMEGYLMCVSVFE